MITELKVPGMMCQHCEKSVKKALLEMEGVKSVLVDLDAKKVTAEHIESVPVEALKEALEEIGYEAEERG